MTNAVSNALTALKLPEPNSHKGDNGKLLVIAGSQLFHAPVRWVLEVASRLVDMLFVSSVPLNNELLTELKQTFWDGIVVPREQVEAYCAEADCILIGPGMERGQFVPSSSTALKTPPTADEWNFDTQKITQYLLRQFAQKKWVVDAGALQMVTVADLPPKAIISPHARELEQLAEKSKLSVQALLEQLQHQGVTVVLKGREDVVYTANKVHTIVGGHAGMTKGGTGDVLAGLLAGLYATNTAEVAALVGSFVNKQAGAALANRVGPFFNASDVAAQIPHILATLTRSSSN